ncbi:MAG: tetraacyldisaccharide 4'-kinase [Gammaproteobacteria bacterium]|nr:tetraacyldisaccharide 4'-kinase [Gammaproteobacteria bacterium]
MSPDPLLDKLWYENHRLSVALAPLSWLYAAAMWLRRMAYIAGLIPVGELLVPVIVVGNITVGGTGKTPLVIWLAQFLKEKGFSPGIVSRGYGGRPSKMPQQARPDSSPEAVGDEPVLMAQRTGCPVAVSPRRFIAARELVQRTGCNIILCDDGLQHYALGRDIEIAVIDGDRRFGNGRCLPAGPLREPASRLRSVDMVVANAKASRSEFLMEYSPQPLRSVADENRRINVESLRGREVHAVAGVGNPNRFFSYLRSQGLNIVKHRFPDHHPFSAADFRFGDELPIVMTEKDAVKCRRFATDRFWYLPIEAVMPAAFQHRLGVLLGNL